MLDLLPFFYVERVAVLTMTLSYVRIPVIVYNFTNFPHRYIYIYIYSTKALNLPYINKRNEGRGRLRK